MTDRQYKIFDTHTHMFPDKIAASTMQKIGADAAIKYYHNGSFDGLCQYEENGGAAGFLILPIATNTRQVRAVNDFAASKMGGAIHCFGSVHPDYDDIDGELDRIVSFGMKGVKLHPEYQDFFADEERMFPLYEKIAARGLIMDFHAGIDLAFSPPYRGAPHCIAKVADTFPQAKIVAAHMGGITQIDEVFETLAGRANVWFDTSFAHMLPPEFFVRLTREHGVERVMFGTDAPWTSFEDSKAAVLNAGFEQSEIEDIFYNNAARLLGL